MEIDNVKLMTKTKYVANGDEYDPRNDKPLEILEITVPLPGGQAVYEIPLTKGQKNSLEFASKLSKEGKV